MSKLADLANICGITEMELLEARIFDSVCEGICINKGCDYTCTVESDSSDGWCEECEENTVTSALILAGII